jgi:hypothetical protein
MDRNRVFDISGFSELGAFGDGFDSHRPLQNPDNSVDLTRLSYLNLIPGWSVLDGT